MNRTFAMLASAAIVGFALTTSDAAEVPLPPQVNFVATAANQLQLGMTGDDVIRVMGKAAKETDFADGSTQMRKLEFMDAIPGQVVLSDGKVSRVTLDAFRMEKDGLPPFIRQAWPGFASCVVRRALGEPSAHFHHKFFDIEIDQWVYVRAGVGEASVFFRADRVIARGAGRNVPADLFRVELPSRPDAEGESPMVSLRLGMTTGEMDKLYGTRLYRVDYVFNGQPASRVVYKVSEKGTFTAITLVDGVVTGLEDLGRTPGDPAFQGR